MQRTQPKTKIGASKGSTLVELTVVLAVIAIVMTMIVSFTVLIKRHQSKNDQEFLFLETYSKVKKDFLEWFFTVDGENTVYSILGGDLVATNDGGVSKLSFANGTLTVGDSVVVVSNVDSIVFFATDQLIKCTVYATINGVPKGLSFAFSPRCGRVLPNQSQQGGSNA